MNSTEAAKAGATLMVRVRARAAAANGRVFIFFTPFVVLGRARLLA